MNYALVVEDQRMPREFMEHVLTRCGFVLVPSVTAAEFTILQCERHPIALVMMDVCTNGVQDGIEAAVEIKKKFPKTKVIIVTSMVEESYLRRARAADVDSFWYKDVSPEDLSDVVRRTMAGEQIFPDRTPEVQIGLTKSTELTEMEIQVLRFVCEGYENAEIAEMMGTKVSTTKTHIAHILTKTGYSNKTQLAIAAIKNHLIFPKLSGK